MITFQICVAYQGAANSLLNSVHSGKIIMEEARLTEELLINAIKSVKPRTTNSLLRTIETFKSSKLSANK